MQDGDTPLIWACRNGCTNIAKLLLGAGAAKEAKNKVMHTCVLGVAIGRFLSGVYGVLVKYDSALTVFFFFLFLSPFPVSFLLPTSSCRPTCFWLICAGR